MERAAAATDVERTSHFGDGQRNESEHDYVTRWTTTQQGGRHAGRDIRARSIHAFSEN